MFEQLRNYISSRIVLNASIEALICNIVIEAQLCYDEQIEQVAFISAMIEDTFGIEERKVKEVFIYETTSN